MFINIDRNLSPQKPKYFLAKPNMEIVANMTSYKYEDGGTFKLGNIDEINFTVPYYIDEDFKHIYNDDIDLIKEKMLIKMVLGTSVEWFIIDEIEETGDSSEELSVTAYSLPYELTHKDIPVYEAIGVNATDALMDILEDTHYPTAWKVEDVHYKFNNMYRSFDMSDTNALDAVFQIAEAFDALIKWNTETRRISFLDKESNGQGTYKGLSIDYGRLLRTFKRSRTSDEMVTRLYVSGNEGLGIHNVNPTGQSYIEDFSYYMYPFEMDANGNVLKSSHFMTDELCIALKRYEALIAQYAVQFKTLNQNRALLISQRNTSEAKLLELETQLDSIRDRLDMAKAVENQELISKIQLEKSIKESEINSQNTLISGIKRDISTVEGQIIELTNKLRKDANFTTILIEELKLYIVERRFDDDRYIDEQELYNDALKKFKSMREPKVVLTIDVENFLEIVEEQYYWDKLILGDLIKIRYPLMNIEYMATLVQIDYDFEDGNISLTIANTKKLNENDEIKEILYNSKTASSIIMNNKHIFEKVGELDGRVWRLLNEEWDANKQKITAGVNNEIEIGKRGIVVTNPDNPNEMVVIQSGIIALSEDGGETWKTAMKPNGIVAERIIGKLIMSTRLVIEDENGIIKFTGSLQQIFDNHGNIRIEIGNYAVGKYGMRIHGGAIEIVEGLPKSQIEASAVNKWDSAESNANSYTNSKDVTIRSDLRLTSALPTSISMNNNGITAYSSANSNNFARLDYRGLYVQGGAVDIRTSGSTSAGVIFDGKGISAYNYAGTKTFYVDTNGNFFANSGTFAGTLSSANGTFTGTLSAVSGTFTTLTSGTISGATIQGTNISGGTITGTNINGGNINVSTDVTIGNNLYLVGSNSYTRGIYFRERTGDRIETDGATLSIIALGVKIYGAGVLEMYSTLDMTIRSTNGSVNFGGRVSFANATVTGLNTTATFG